jgi:hypothetical protein
VSINKIVPLHWLFFDHSPQSDLCVDTLCAMDHFADQHIATQCDHFNGGGWWLFNIQYSMFNIQHSIVQMSIHKKISIALNIRFSSRSNSMDKLKPIEHLLPNI